MFWNIGDDAVDTDQSWAGTLDNFVIITPSGNCFELDGPEGTYVAGHVIRNGSVIASSEDVTSQDLINTDDNSVVDLENIFITSIADGQVINRTEYTEGNVTFTNVTMDVVPANLADYVNGTVVSGISAGTTPQANTSVLSWTWASQAGAVTF